MKRLLSPIVLLFTLIILPALSAQDSPLPVVATTSIIADVARNVGGDLVEVAALVPPDTDVHAFQPAPQDAVIIEQAAVVLVNGAGLEEGLLQLVESAATVPLTVVSDGVEALAFGGDDVVCALEDEHDTDDEHEHDADEHEHGPCDPHFWGDPQNVQVWADNIASAFAAADPVNAEVYLANAATYNEQLDALDAELEAMFDAIPRQQRVIVTNHEFLGYFAARYGFEVAGTVIPGATTLVEPAPQDVAALIETIEAEGVKAIFVEVSDTSTLAGVIASDASDVEVVTLYSGSLSAPDGPAATYIDYMRTNARMIVDALG